MTSLEPVVEKLFSEAQKRGASDIHLEPLEKGLRVRFRVGGQMVEGGAIPEGLKESLPAKLKLLARLDSTKRMIPHDGALKIAGAQGRLSTIPVLGGESVVIRLFSDKGDLEKLANLGVLQAQYELFASALRRPWGLFVISGPTGSGKTTTFYAALREINPAAQKIITVEDPVEQRLKGVTQVPVAAGTTFAVALRSILRHAPNVMGVGEIRDGESAAMALQAALTGHLVVATVHAGSVAGVISRLRELGLNPAMLAEVLCGVSSQRLLQLRHEGQTRTRGIFEVYQPSRAFATAIKNTESTARLEKILEEESFLTLRQNALKLVENAELTREAFLSEFGGE